MPRRYNSKRNVRRSKRIPYRRRRYRRNRVASSVPVPNTKIVRLRFCSLKAHTHTLAKTTIFNRYACNDLFDPDLQVGGHQPYLFDQMMQLYSKYTVLGAKITVTCTGGSAPGQFGIVCKPDLIDPVSDPSELMEHPRSRWAFTHHNASRSVSYNISMRKLFGIRDLCGDIRFTGNNAAVPQLRGMFFIWTFSPYVAQEMGITVKIEFTAKFQNRIYAGRS